MKRRLFNLAAGISLLLMTAAGVMWVRSYWRTDQFQWQRVDGVRSFSTAAGYAVLGVYRYDASVEPAGWYGLKYTLDAAHSVGWDRMGLLFLETDPGDINILRDWGGLGWYERIEARGNWSITCVLPFWSIALATAALPMVWIALRWRVHRLVRRRMSVGLCPACGYDLRATPGRCPECGLSSSAALSDCAEMNPVPLRSRA